MNDNYFETLFLGLAKQTSSLRILPSSRLTTPWISLWARSKTRKGTSICFKFFAKWRNPLPRLQGARQISPIKSQAFLLIALDRKDWNWAQPSSNGLFFWVNGDQLEIIECSSGIAHCAGSFRREVKVRKLKNYRIKKASAL